jgi:predicted nucleic acid-binding Zn ribbon protein
MRAQINEKEERFCEYCEEPITGRSDKRFCSDYCRNSKHNLENKDNSNYMRKVNNILRRNRRILARLNPTGKAKVMSATLMEEGFNFAYYTNVYETKKGGKYHFCYDQGYIKLEDGWYALVERQSYVK